jgi:hypothetical protein
MPHKWVPCGKAIENFKENPLFPHKWLPSTLFMWRQILLNPEFAVWLYNSRGKLKLDQLNQPLPDIERDLTGGASLLMIDYIFCFGAMRSLGVDRNSWEPHAINNFFSLRSSQHQDS